MHTFLYNIYHFQLLTRHVTQQRQHWHVNVTGTMITGNHNHNNTTTTTNGRNRDGRGGKRARDRRVSSLTGMFFLIFFYNYTNFILNIHSPPVNLDASTHYTTNYPRHYGTTIPPTTHTAWHVTAQQLPCHHERHKKGPNDVKRRHS